MINDWVAQQVRRESYWFHRIDLGHGLVTPGWSDPRTEKLPYFGLPDDLAGKRVLDVGCAEGFFSFEAERRGAREVVAIDSSPDSVRRFGICRAALDSRVTPFLTNVYDLSPKTFGTFDFVLCYGVLYHLRHPLLALERIRDVCVGCLLVQTAVYEDARVDDVPPARFHPRGLASGPNRDIWDPTVFWLPNRACVVSLLESAGYADVETLSAKEDVGLVARAQSPSQTDAQAPDQAKAPWS